MLASLSLLPTPHFLLPLLKLMGYFCQPELDLVRQSVGVFQDWSKFRAAFLVLQGFEAFHEKQRLSQLLKSLLLLALLSFSRPPLALSPL